MKRLVAVLALAIVACSPARPAGSAPQSSAFSTPVVTSPGTPNAPTPGLGSSRSSTTRLGSPAAVRVAPFPGCRLPVAQNSIAASIQGGFISGKDGHFTADPAGVFTVTAAGVPVSVAKPTLRGSFSRETVGYDAVIDRWLPVAASSVRPDGLAYAYAEAYKVRPTDQFESLTRIHMVSLPDGVDRVVYAGATVDVMNFAVDGIYIVSVPYYHGEGTSGLWKLDPDTRKLVKLLDSDVNLVAIVQGVGWSIYPSLGSKTLTAVQLSTGARQTWVDLGDRGPWLNYIGSDARGRPFVIVNENAGESNLWLYSAPGRASRVGPAPTGYGLAVTDAHGTWFPASDGIYLFDPGRGYLRVSTSGSTGYAAGACV